LGNKNFKKVSEQKQLRWRAKKQLSSEKDLGNFFSPTQVFDLP